MDNLVLDAETLVSVANNITAYTLCQKELIRNYSSNILSLNSDWKDDETFSKMVEEIISLRNSVNVLMEQVTLYADYFREKAASIVSRPMPTISSHANSHSAASGHSTTGYNLSHSSSSGSFASSPNGTDASYEGKTFALLSNQPIERQDLNKYMCKVDAVPLTDGYVRISGNGRRIADMPAHDFYSPKNGKPIVCKKLAWRSAKSVEEADPENVCGADFEYLDGKYCCTYIGNSWENLWNQNVEDTKVMRNKK